MWEQLDPPDTTGSLTIIGAGNHSRDIQAIAARCGILTIRLYDDIPQTGVSKPPIGFDDPAIVGVNDSVLRKSIANRLRIVGFRPLIDPSAVIGTDARIGVGVVIAPLVSLLTDVELGDHVHVNYQASMTRCKVAPFSTISPGAVICGNVEIGECTTIGAGAIVCERTTIGDRVIVGAGAIIPPYSVVPSDTVVKGVWKTNRA